MPRTWLGWALWIVCTGVAGWFVGAMLAHYLAPHPSAWQTVQHLHATTTAWWSPLSWDETIWRWMACISGFGWGCWW